MRVLKKDRYLSGTVHRTGFSAMKNAQGSASMKNELEVPILPLFPDLTDNANDELRRKGQHKLEEMRLALSDEKWQDALFSGYESVLQLSKLLLLKQKRYIASEKAIIDQTKEILDDTRLAKMQDYEMLTLQVTVDIDPVSILNYAVAVEHFFQLVMNWEKGIAV